MVLVSKADAQQGEKLADFAEHDVTLRRGWTEYNAGKHRWTGVLALPAPAFLVALMPTSADGAWYEKSRRLIPGDYDVRLEEDHTIADRRRLMLLGERTIDVNAYYGLGGEPRWRRTSFFGLNGFLAPGAEFFELPTEPRFKAGRPVAWRSEISVGSSLRLLVLAASDVATKRNGIWGFKRRHHAALPAGWHPVLTRTRRGLANV